MGLGEVAEQLLKMPGFMPAIANCVDPRRKGVENLHKVQEGIKNIISHVFCKDTDVLEAIQDMLVQVDFFQAQTAKLRRNCDLIFCSSSWKCPKQREKNPLLSNSFALST